MHHSFKNGFVVGVIAGAVGALFLYKKRRTIMGKIWQLKVRADVHRRVSNLKKVTREVYEEVVDEVIDRYRDMEAIAATELDAFADLLKRDFRKVKEAFEEAAKEVKEEKE